MTALNFKSDGNVPFTGGTPSAGTVMASSDTVGNVVWRNGVLSNDSANRKLTTGSFVFGPGAAGVNTSGAVAHNLGSTPTAIVASARGQGFTDTFAVSTDTVGATTFLVNIFRVDNGGGTWAQNLVIDWIAIL